MRRAVLTAVFLIFPIALRAQTPCEALRYFDPAAQDVVYTQAVPTVWWGVRMTAQWTATVDTAYVGFGVQRHPNSGFKPDTLEIRILADKLPQFQVLHTMTLLIQPTVNGTVPDGYYIAEFSFQQPVAYIDPPSDFWLSWRLRGPAGDVARIFLRRPAINPLRSVVIRTNGTTTPVSAYVRPAINDSVDLWAETRVCYPNGIPVEMQSFEAAYQDGSGVLTWSTATESGNAGFEVERLESVAPEGNARLWRRLGFVPGHGTSTQPHEYRFTDMSPDAAADAQGVVRYRLRQMDFDGRSVATPATELLLPSIASAFSLAQPYPHPLHRASNAATIAFTLPESSPARLEVFDALGRRVAVLAEGTLRAGRHTAVFRAAGLPSGLYTCVLTGLGGRCAQRLVVAD